MEKILLVDDCSEQLHFLEKLLACPEFEIITAGSGNEALGLVLEHDFSLILLAARMAEMDGFETAELIRGSDDFCHIPLIFFGESNTELPFSFKGEEHGEVAFICKPGQEAGILRRQAKAMISAHRLGLRQTTPGAAKAEAKTKEADREFVTGGDAAPRAGAAPKKNSHESRILLVEDNMTNQMVARILLKKLGFCADIAASGQEALLALENGRYDLVLMDCQMPGMDGYEATRRIRAWKNSGSEILRRQAGLPIVAMTAHAMPGDREKCLQAGMNDYLMKPIQPQILARILEDWLLSPLPGPRQEPRQDQEQDGSGVYDRLRVMSRLQVDEAAMSHIVALFLHNMPQRLLELRQALDRQDGYMVQLQAHTIKGAAGSIGAPALENIARHIEQAGRDGDLAKAAALLPEIEKQIIRLQQAIQRTG